MSTWQRYTDENGQPEVKGTDGGAILLDDEHGWGARITLEQPGAFGPFGITCGIYEWMVHTHYCATLEVARRDYAAMKAELEAILELIPLRSDPAVDQKMERVSTEISRFVDKFP